MDILGRKSMSDTAEQAAILPRCAENIGKNIMIATEMLVMPSTLGCTATIIQLSDPSSGSSTYQDTIKNSMQKTLSAEKTLSKIEKSIDQIHLTMDSEDSSYLIQNWFENMEQICNED